MADQDRLPQYVVAEDRRLERGVSQASEELAKLRWHWTLDEENPKRVSVSAYARDVGVSRQTIHRYAHGYQAFRVNDVVDSLAAGIVRASHDAATSTATEAIAKARGLSPLTVERHRGEEVREVRAQARDRADEKGTDFEDEVKVVAHEIVKAERAAQELFSESRDQPLVRSVEFDQHLYSVLESLRGALQLAQSVSWDDEDRDIMTAFVREARRKILRFLEMIEIALAGKSAEQGVDWDKEIAALLELRRGGR